MVNTYRTRFAPSPTGRMHMGHARTALVTWLRARSVGGEILMRIEDIDRPRVVEGAAVEFLQDHEWLGLDWDVGPVYQSQHGALYEESLDVLRHNGLVFACTCSRKEIANIASAPHGDLGVRYPGTCRNGVQRPERPNAIRFKAGELAVGFTDQVLGEVTELVDDFVLRRADGVWAYQFAVVVDDIDAGITEVIRGADLLSSTPRQIALHNSFGREAPAFAHVPLVIGHDGRRLSKRYHSATIRDYRQAGWSPERVIGTLAGSLGLVDDGRDASLDEALAVFDIRAIPKHTFVVPLPAEPKGL